MRLSGAWDEQIFTCKPAVEPGREPEAGSKGWFCPWCKAESGSPCPALAQAHGGWVLGDPATLQEHLWTPSGPSKQPPAHSASQAGCSGDGDKQLQHLQPVGREGHEPVCPRGTQRWLDPGEHGWRVLAGEAGRCSKMRRFSLLLPKSLLLSSSPQSAAMGWQARSCSLPALPLGCALSQVRTRTRVLLPRQGATVVCIAQAQLLVQTLVQVPPLSCRGSPRCPRAARVSPRPRACLSSTAP